MALLPYFFHLCNSGELLQTSVLFCRYIKQVQLLFAVVFGLLLTCDKGISPGGEDPGKISVPVTGVTLDQRSITLPEGGTSTLKATIERDDKVMREYMTNVNRFGLQQLNEALGLEIKERLALENNGTSDDPKSRLIKNYTHHKK
jgi:hypothetical protein